ncbi:stress-responsive transcription factor HSF1 TDEL_0E05170 [Torulaspora delbrueckii]|uniref:Heat shock transcription factor n=1 Tax=Torulaspora delbrueckii TaxID=4950 RepID=G8ZVW6_TORDE|nr:hypothetical protein TDEL_0E05170 [Torulaspora delbrueckii]CCE92760.1 hypothetical protein TDEL_0E05170 [Torulaspora delbrueckii]
MEKVPSLNDDDIEKILHPSNLFNEDLRPLEKVSPNGAIEDIINPSMDPQSITPSTDGIPSIPHEPGQHLIQRMTPVGLYPHQDDRLNNQLLPMYRNSQALPQQSQQQQSSTRHTKTRPAFVNKVWSMLNDESNVNLIQWSKDGKSFIVVNREEFVHQILPKYFKHSNLASFVRQLNMYGWHKVQDVKSGSIQNSSDDKLQFENEYFIRGREDLLEKIVRQKSSAATNSKSSTNSNASGSDLHLLGDINLGDQSNVTALLGELEQIKYDQMAISKDLLRINKDNEMLWKENMMARERHRTQQQALEKILRFLASLVPHMDQKMITEGILNNDDPSQVLQTHQDTQDNNSGAQPANMDLFDPEFLRNLPKSRFLLKNRTSSTASNPDRSQLDGAKISEIPFDEEDENHEHNDTPQRNSISGQETVSFLNHLQSNIDEQDARIQHLEDMVQVISPSGSQQKQPNFDLQDYCFNNNSPMDAGRSGTGLSPLLPPEGDDMIPLHTQSPASNLIGDLGTGQTNPKGKRYLEHEPLVEEIADNSSNDRKRPKR